MKKQTKNTPGLTAVEGLVIILALAVIGFGGYYVWHTQHDKTKTVATTTSSSSGKSSTTSSKTTTSSSGTSNSTTYLDITQVGIKLPLPATISDLSYAWVNSVTPAQANLSSASLATYAKQTDPSDCSAMVGNYPLGTITTNSELGGTSKAVTVNGTVYYYYSPPNGCAASGTTAANSVVSQYETYQNALDTAFSHAHAE